MKMRWTRTPEGYAAFPHWTIRRGLACGSRKRWWYLQREGQFIFDAQALAECKAKADALQDS